MAYENPRYPARLNTLLSESDQGITDALALAALSCLKGAESWDAEDESDRGDRLRAEAQVYATLFAGSRI
jgi:hypothetical protein